MKISEILTDKSKWCQGVRALNQVGNIVSPLDSSACRWCLVGAALRAYGYDQDNPLAYQKLRDAARKLYPWKHPEYLAVFNDREETTFDMVRKVIEHAGV